MEHKEKIKQSDKLADAINEVIIKFSKENKDVNRIVILGEFLREPHGFGIEIAFDENPPQTIQSAFYQRFVDGSVEDSPVVIHNPSSEKHLLDGEVAGQIKDLFDPNKPYTPVPNT